MSSGPRVIRLALVPFLRRRGRSRNRARAGLTLRTAATLTAILTTMAFGTGSARASITLGETSSNDLQFSAIYASTEVETASGQAPSYTVPAGGGVITSWSNQAAVGTEGEMKLKVLRPTAEPNRFAVVGESALETITPAQLDTFPTEIPVQAGDLLGSSRTAGTTMSVFFITPNAGDMAAQANGADDPLGSTTTFNPPQGHFRLDISAVLRQQAGIGSVGPSSGPITGGTPVTISGHDFSGATAVSFGSTPAASFTVDSEFQITAVAPPAAPGTVDLTVTTPLGASAAVAADSFTYTACVVPKLRHRDLKAAKEVLHKRECRPGKVSRVLGSDKAARVIKQGKRPQTVLPPGAKVSIRLGGSGAA